MVIETLWTLVMVALGALGMFALTAVLLAAIIILHAIACCIYDWLRWW